MDTVERYKGKSAVYLDYSLTRARIKKRLPYLHMAQFIFCVDDRRLLGLRFGSDGTLIPCKITERNAYRVITPQVPGDIITGFDQGGPIAKRVYAITWSMSVAERELEVGIWNSVISAGKGATYEQVVNRIYKYALESCTFTEKTFPKNTVVDKGYRNTILRYDGRNVYWFDDQDVWCSMPLKEAASAEKPLAIWSMVTKNNKLVRFWKDAGFGRPTDFIDKTVYSQFLLNKNLNMGNNAEWLSLSVLSELQVGETVEDFRRKMPAWDNARNLLRGSFAENFFYEYDMLYSAAPLVEYSYDTMLDSKDKPYRITCSATLDWTSRLRVRDYLRDHKAEAKEALLNYISSVWRTVSRAYARELYDEGEVTMSHDYASIELILELSPVKLKEQHRRIERAEADAEDAAFAKELDKNGMRALQLQLVDPEVAKNPVRKVTVDDRLRGAIQRTYDHVYANWVKRERDPSVSAVYLFGQAVTGEIDTDFNLGFLFIVDGIADIDRLQREAARYRRRYYTGEVPYCIIVRSEDYVNNSNSEFAAEMRKTRKLIWSEEVGFVDPL